MRASGYGDMIAKYLNAKLVSYECYGSYQGDFIAITLKEDTGIFDVWKGSYGSCSGCDWFQATANYDYATNDDCCEISDKDVKEYMDGMQPFLSIPIDCIHLHMDIESLLPANSRLDTYGEFSYDSIKVQLLKAKEDLLRETGTSEEAV